MSLQKRLQEPVIPKKFKTQPRTLLHGLLGQKIIKEESPEAFQMRENNEASDRAWLKERRRKKLGLGKSSKRSMPKKSISQTKVPKKFVAVKNPLPFNLEKAKNGAQLVTRSGYEAKLIGINNFREDEKVVFVTNGKFNKWSDVRGVRADGKVYIDEIDDYDLFINVESVEKWICLEENTQFVTSRLYSLFDKEAKALDFATINKLLIPPFKIYVRK